MGDIVVAIKIVTIGEEYFKRNAALEFQEDRIDNVNMADVAKECTHINGYVDLHLQHCLLSPATDCH